MRIEDIRCWVVEAEHPAHPYRWRKGLAGSGDGTPADRKPLKAVIRMDTDAGITGAIEVTNAWGAMSLVDRRLKRLIGENPLLTERLWTLVWEIDRIEEIPMPHLGIVDLLAWDIKAKAAGMPLHQLLGGHDRRVPAYASTVTWDSMAEYERHIKECIDVGFTAFKLHAWGDAKEDAARTASSATRSTSRSWRPRPRMAAIGTWPAGSRPARSTWRGPAPSTRAA